MFSSFIIFYSYSCVLLIDSCTGQLLTSTVGYKYLNFRYYSFLAQVVSIFWTWFYWPLPYNLVIFYSHLLTGKSFHCSDPHIGVLRPDLLLFMTAVNPLVVHIYILVLFTPTIICCSYSDLLMYEVQVCTTYPSILLLVRSTVSSSILCPFLFLFRSTNECCSDLDTPAVEI